MKLFTRIKISFMIICIVPILLVIIAIYGIMSSAITSIEKQYDVEDPGMDVLYNPLKLAGAMTATTINELEEMSLKKPEKLEDSGYLEKINKKLFEYSSYLIIKKEQNPIFIGKDKGEQNIFDVREEDADYFYIENVPYHIKQRTFKFADGSTGQIIIVTDMHQMLPQVKNTLLKGVFVVLGIFIVGATALIIWLYQSIVKPIGQLKMAAESIKDGNLNFGVKAETDDEIGELCVAFEEMRKQLKLQIDISMQYEKENKELISNISHDLKTPITAIKGYIEGIRDGVADTPEKIDKYMKTIYTKSNDMEKLIEELALYSRIDSNSLSYNFKKVNLNDYFEDCIEEIRVDLEEKDIGLGFFNYTDKDTIVIADPEQLKRVITNIVSNSAKYINREKGLINIRIKEEAEFIQVEIEDNGKGIAKNELPHIFERCYRTDASRNSAQGGSGLGLSIAKKIIEEHGGQIWATSKEGIGTSLCFVLRRYEEGRIYE